MLLTQREGKRGTSIFVDTAFYFKKHLNHAIKYDYLSRTSIDCFTIYF